MRPVVAPQASNRTLDDIHDCGHRETRCRSLVSNDAIDTSDDGSRHEP